MHSGTLSMQRARNGLFTKSRSSLWTPTKPIATQRSPAASDKTSHVTATNDVLSSNSRRVVLGMLGGSALLHQMPANAVQGYIAGRIPGVSEEVDENGFHTYLRPEGKQGGHGVGWSEIPQYSFKIPDGWEENPVSIADLGGTEIDLRFSSKEEGSLQVVVAPVLRFADVGYNANVRIEKLAPPERVIAGFHPELFGATLDEENVVETKVVDKNGLKYYMWEIKPRKLVIATAAGNRLFIMALTGNARQWRKYEDKLRLIQESFTVPELRMA